MKTRPKNTIQKRVEKSSKREKKELLAKKSYVLITFVLFVSKTRPQSVISLNNYELFRNSILKEDLPIVEEKINMNPTRLATSMLSGIAPNYATQVYMMKNKSFAKAYVNALSLQTVIGDLQNVKGIQERFIKGLAWLEDDIFDYSWTILCSRRNDLSQDWPETNKKEWLKFIESQKYPKDKKDKIINILKLKNEKPNPYSKISKYYYENLQ